MKTNVKEIHFGSYRVCNQVGEAKALITNTSIVITIFLYEYILTKFGCPLIVTYQGISFINDIIKHLIEQILLKHVNSTTYYP
jgi:hypothetical protein